MFLHRKKINRISWALLLALGLSACASVSSPEPVPTVVVATFTPAPPTPTLEPVALTVNGEGVTVVEFEAEVRRYLAAQSALGNSIDEQTAAEAVADDLIAQLLLAQAARLNGFTLDDAALQARIDSLAAQIGGAEALSAWRNAQGYSEQAFRSALRRAAEAAWMRDTIAASVPGTAEQVHVQQILLYNQATAQDFLSQLNGGADFDELAARADPLTRGELGWVPRGYLLDPQIEEAAFGLETGQYSDVIATNIGFHILKVLERDPNRPLSPDAYLALQEQTLRRWVQEQKRLANVTLFLP
ncbi:MAG: peptidylprolyl isomerase [Anaerolineales bacterium]|nr:peptidylprolyl isomerase [Anaerolineales bacterium]NUQ84301.1 peptidylprolyl isomerase [Anaerolineales bacterium]